MLTQEAHQVMPIIELFPNSSGERLRALEEKFKAMEVHDTPGLDVVDMYLVPCLEIPQKFKVSDSKNTKELVV